MNQAIVLDCSATVTWLLPDETTDKSEALLNYVAISGAIVPNLWCIEISNTLLVAQRRKRIDNQERLNALSKLKNLPIEIDEYTAEYTFTTTAELAKKHDLSVYDATYLELALRFKYPLATFDKALIKAAHRCNLKII